VLPATSLREVCKYSRQIRSMVSISVILYFKARVMASIKTEGAILPDSKNS
jgi:hypothetical protein